MRVIHFDLSCPAGALELVNVESAKRDWKKQKKTYSACVNEARFGAICGRLIGFFLRSCIVRNKS